MPSKTPNLDLWRERAEKVIRTTFPLNIPIAVALKEMAEGAAFVKKYWKKTAKLPGLSQVKARLSETVANELATIRLAFREAETEWRKLIAPTVAADRDRGIDLVSELQSALNFLLDDNVEELADEQLAQFKDFHAKDGKSIDALAQSLNDYGYLANKLRKRLTDIDETFNPQDIDDAIALGQKLTDTPIDDSEETGAIRKARILRNQLLWLGMERLRKLRHAARRVFRDHPEIVREVTSAYERRRRAEGRVKKLRELQQAKAAEKPKATAAKPKDAAAKPKDAAEPKK